MVGEQRTFFIKHTLDRLGYLCSRFSQYELEAVIGLEDNVFLVYVRHCALRGVGCSICADIQTSRVWQTGVSIERKRIDILYTCKYAVLTRASARFETTSAQIPNPTQKQLGSPFTSSPDL